MATAVARSNDSMASGKAMSPFSCEATQRRPSRRRASSSSYQQQLQLQKSSHTSSSPAHKRQDSTISASSSNSDCSSISSSTVGALADLAIYSRSPRQALYVLRRLNELKRAADRAAEESDSPQANAASFAYAKYILDHAARLEIGQHAWLSEAVTVLHDLALRRYPVAQTLYADLLLEGPPCADPSQPILVQRDNEGAFRLYRQASERGDADAAYKAAIMVRDRKVPWGSDTRTESGRLLALAAAQNHPGALHALATDQLTDPSDVVRTARGLKLLRLAADHANRHYPDALHDLALIHQRGVPLLSIPPDAASALNLLLDAADLRHAPSHNTLGTYYASAATALPPTSPDRSRFNALSVHHQSVAANLSHPQAQLALSQMYLQGVPGVLEKDPAEAYLLARKAADAGLARAQCVVGHFVEAAQVVRCSDPKREAAMWFARAAKAGSTAAVRALERLDTDFHGSVV
ncbi:hypothetical protein HKX48_003280 [Thoreauomyces humboldtii]|nr:hypothetical protein HKX48_003280 [Thoreauomyces humboldtii]